MGKTKGSFLNSKKEAGNARKAEAAAQKAAAKDAKLEEDEAARWSQGSKGVAKKEAEQAKRAEQARKKAERNALLEEEVKNIPSPSPGRLAAKSAVKKSRGLDLSQLDSDGPTSAGSSGAGSRTLNASGIDNALDALSLTGGSSSNAKIEKHPERRFKAAYTQFEERRLAEMQSDGSGDGLRLNQKKEKIKKEFERSAENPFNQVTARYDASKEEIAQLRDQEKAKIEARLGS